MGSALLGMVTHRDVDFLNEDQISMRVTEVSVSTAELRCFHCQ